MSLPDPLLAALARLAASRGLAPPDRVLAASVPGGPDPSGPPPRLGGSGIEGPCINWEMRPTSDTSKGR